MSITYEGFAPGAFFIAGGFIASIIIAILAVFVFRAVIRWKIFVKAGEAGWKSLIPIYGDYVEYRLMWEGKWFWIQLICAFAASALWPVPIIGFTAVAAAAIVASIVEVIFYMQEAHAFGQDDGFAVGLIMLGSIFQIFLAFNNEIQYRGPQATPSFFTAKRKNEAPHNNDTMEL